MLGCFGLSIRTKDIDLEEEFSRYGRVEKATIVYDQRVSANDVPMERGVASTVCQSHDTHAYRSFRRIPHRIVYTTQSERSRGFGFVTMASQEEAEKCIEKLNGIELHGRNIRVAYSMTTKPHQSTPGEYMGFKTNPPRFGDRERYPPRDRYDDRRDRDRGYGGGYRRDDRYDDRRDRDRGYDRGYSRRDDRYDDRRDDRYDDRRGGSSRRDDSPRRRSPRDYDRY